MATNEELDYLVSRVAKVRKWLAAIAVLKTATICLLFACIYIGGYIILDHRFNFSLPGRLIAFFLLAGLTVFLVYKLSRLLLVQISYTNAANFIENNYSLNQQLVAAMEYYENKADYPYSKVLAEQLIIRVNKDSETFAFDSVVEKWHGFALAAFVFLGLGVVGFYVQHNISFLATYFARLAVPFSSVAPISATTLESITRDIVSEPESMLTISAKINGLIPDSGQLIIAPIGHDSNDHKIQLKPTEELGTEPKFETSEFFSKTGQFKYQFKADLAQTPWHNIDIREAPQIKSITAEIELPQNIRDDETLKKLSEQIKNNTLEIIKNSSVTLHIESSSNLSEIEITNPNGTSSKSKLNGENTFSHTFTAKEQGDIEFHLTDDKGLKSKNIPKLKILLKTDNPPQFKLISPDGDYLATNVSSIPIEFKITDDFGLSSAKFIAELPKGEPISIDIPIQPDSNEARFSYILELEQYELVIGDSIMFYANATDIKTSISDKENASCSEIYFIEIRPYLQIWHLKEAGKGKSNPAPVPEDLMTLLEYTRAFIKKTSVVAGKTSLDADDRSNLKSINEDVEYCASLLIQLRDDPHSEFNEAQKAVLNEILKYYENASSDLERFKTADALLNEKEAYRILRKFILELEMDYNPPADGETVPKETPDKLKLKEAIESPEIEPEQMEEALEEVQDNIEQLQAEQNQLQEELDKALKQQKQANEQAKANAQADQQSSNNNSNQNGNISGQSEQNGDSQQQGEGSSGQGNQGQQSNNSQQGEGSSGQGNSNPQSNSQLQGEGSSGQGNQGQQGNNSQQGEGSSASSIAHRPSSILPGKTPDDGRETSQAIAQAQLKMLQAKQSELQSNVSQLQQKLESIAKNSEGSMSQLSKEVQKQLGEALENMEQFQEKMDELQYQPHDFDNKSEEASKMMESAAKKLESAGKSLESGLNSSEEGKLAKELKKNADELSEDAEKLDNKLSESERIKMEALLEAANKLLDSQAAAHRASVSRGNGNQGTGMHVLTEEGGAADRDTAREIARHFRFLAIELEKKKEQPIEDEPSDSRFVEAESDFFENAAKYNTGENGK